MERIKELIEVLSGEEVIMNTNIAKSTCTCKICGKPAQSFRNPFSKLEYSISLICQSCQDYYFLDDGMGTQPDRVKR